MVYLWAERFPSEIESIFRCGLRVQLGLGKKVVTGSPMQFEAHNGAVVLKSRVVSAHVPSESTL